MCMKDTDKRYCAKNIWACSAESIADSVPFLKTKLCQEIARRPVIPILLALRLERSQGARAEGAGHNIGSRPPVFVKTVILDCVALSLSILINSSAFAT